MERSENVILLGPPGVGKTHLAIALGVKAVDAGHRVLFMPLDRLIATLMKAKQENRLERQLQQLSYARVLILDEIGYLPMNSGFAPIFPDTCYHLTHYWPAAADIPVASDNPVHYADAIRYNARTPLQGSLLPLTRLV